MALSTIDESRLKEQMSRSSYLDTIFKVSRKYLERMFSPAEIDHLRSMCDSEGGRYDVIQSFVANYYEFVKRRYQSQHQFDVAFDGFVGSNNEAVKLVWGDCLDAMQRMRSESVQLMVTSPPYYNAREYSSWSDLDAYLADMKTVIKEAYRVLDNHRPFVFNVGDIFDNDHLKTRSTWGKRRIPLGAYFTQIFEDVGFQFVDDFIWDKGEVQSQRHKHGEHAVSALSVPCELLRTHLRLLQTPHRRNPLPLSDLRMLES